MSRFEHKLSVRFSFENLSKIEKSYISRVEKKKKIGQIGKKRNFIVLKKEEI